LSIPDGTADIILEKSLCEAVDELMKSALINSAFTHPQLVDKLNVFLLGIANSGATEFSSSTMIEFLITLTDKIESNKHDHIVLYPIPDVSFGHDSRTCYKIGKTKIGTFRGLTWWNPTYRRLAENVMHMQWEDHLLSITTSVYAEYLTTSTMYGAASEALKHVKRVTSLIQMFSYFESQNSTSDNKLMPGFSRINYVGACKKSGRTKLVVTAVKETDNEIDLESEAFKTYMDSDFFRKMNKVLNTDNEKLSDFEGRLLLALDWYAKGRLERDKNDAFINFSIVLETLLIDKKSGFEDSITQTIARRGSTLLASTPDQKNRIEKSLKRAYTKRSEIVHGEDHSLDQTDLKSVQELAGKIFVTLALSDYPIVDNKNNLSFRDWFQFIDYKSLKIDKA
jgi:hypothetical protein